MNMPCVYMSGYGKDIPEKTEINWNMIKPYLENKVIDQESIILIRTGYDDQRWGTDGFWEDSPWLSEEAAIELSKTGAGFFGLDFQTEKPGEKNFVVHKALLSGHAVLCEYLFNLHQATPKSLFIALPISISDIESAPVRAILLN